MTMVVQFKKDERDVVDFYKERGNRDYSPTFRDGRDISQILRYVYRSFYLFTMIFISFYNLIVVFRHSCLFTPSPTVTVM